MVEWFRKDVMAFLLSFINCTRLCQLLDPEEFYVNPSAFQRRNDSMESSFTEHVRHYVKAASHLIPTMTL